jgi:hypothetical protein
MKDTNVPQDAAVFRRKASEFRRYAEAAHDPVVHEELLRIASLYEHLAACAEGRHEH